MKWRHARNSHLEQAFSSVPKVKKQTDEKAWTVQRQVLRLKLKSIAYCEQDEKYRRVIIDIIPCVVEEQLLLWRKGKNVQGCATQNSDPMNTILWKVEELGMNASVGHTWNSQDALGTKLNSVKKEAIWRQKPKRWTSWAKSLRAWFWGTTIWGNLTTSRLYQQSSVEFGEKICKLGPKITTFYSPVQAPETQKIVCLLCIRELQCTTLSKEIWAQIQWIL